MENKTNPLNTILTIILILLFPLGIIYCIGTALFSDKRTFATFLGITMIFGIGILLGIYLVQPSWYDPIIAWFIDTWEWIKGIFIK